VKRGCLFGCCGVLAVLAAACFTAGYYAGKLDLISVADRVPTASYIKGDPAVLVHMDPNHAEIRSLLQEGLRRIPAPLRQYVLASLPYEGTLSIEPRRDQDQADITFALSTRRLAGLLESRSSREVWRWWVAQRLDETGIEREGLWVVRSHVPLASAAIDEFNRRWARPAAEPLALEGSHALEVVVDNRGGRAYLALEPLLNPPPQEGDLPPETPPTVDADRLAGFFQLFTTARLTADPLDRNTFAFRLKAECPNAHAAAASHFFLWLLRDWMYARLLERGIVLEGDVQRDDTSLYGVLTIRGYRDNVVDLFGRWGI